MRATATCRCVSLLAALALGVLLAGAGASSAQGQWWDARWNRRCAVVVEGAGAALRDAPVVVKGSRLKQVAAGEPVSAASLRVIGPGGEMPCQLDEFDGGLSLAANANHVLDDNDELVFQADVPADGQARFWLYWSTTPLPPGRYASLTLMGDAMDPALYHDDLQLWNDQCRLGLRGPARGKDPAKNEIDNWGAGCLTLLEMHRLPLININRSWSWVFPQKAVASSPCPDAARWERPRPMARGPVRVAAHVFLRDAEFKVQNQPSVTVDVEHRVWLYERGAYVCFEEIITPRTPAATLPLTYEHTFGIPTSRENRFWYAEKGKLMDWSPTPEQAADGKQGKIVFQASGFDPWMGGHSVALKKGYAVFLDSGEATEGEDRAASCYARTAPVLRYSRKVKNLAASTPVIQRFWVVGMKGEMDGQTLLAAWRARTAPQVRLGPVERRGGE